MLHKNRGSMLITAIFVIVIFTLLIAVMSRMLTDTKQVNVSSVYAVRAENLAKGAVDFALSMLFEQGKESGANSSLWQKLEPTNKAPVDKKNYELINCSLPSMKGKAPFCNDKCSVDSLILKPYNTGSVTDTGVVYEIVATASCQIPWVENSDSGTTSYYPVRRSVRILASDVRWYNIDAIMSAGN